MKTTAFEPIVLPGSRLAGRIGPPLLVTLCLVLALALRLGFGIRAFLADSDESSTVVTLPAAGMDDAVDLAALQALNLFSGEAARTIVPARPATAAQTALNLRLEGLMIAAVPANSVAVIVSNGRQGSYRVGDSLPAGSEVRLESIAGDHVIIVNRGERETLWLYDGRAGGVPQAPATAAPAENPFAATRRALVDGFTNPAAVAKAQTSLAKVMMLTPEIANGRLIGYRLTPGENLKEFVQLGFRTNDVVTSVNGIALDDMGNLPQLYGLMNEATTVSFSLLREGQAITLQISTGNP